VGKGVATEDVVEMADQTFLRQQRARESRRLVRQADQPQPGSAQGLQTFDGARKHRRMLAVDGQVVLLVAGVQGLVAFGGRTDFGQRARQQVLGALAHGARDEVPTHGRQTQIAQRQPQRDFEVADGVDQGAVQIDQGRVEAGRGDGVDQHVQPSCCLTGLRAARGAV
jgi:hypothetical protein